MSEQTDSKNAWESILEQLSSPWDWCLLIAGASIGLIIALIEGWEIGTVAAASGGVSVALGRAFVASFKGSWLRKRATKLIHFLEEEANDPGHIKETDDPESISYRWFFDASECTSLRAQIERDLNLYKDGILTVSQFESALGDHLSGLRKLKQQQSIIGDPLVSLPGESQTSVQIDEVKEFQEQFDKPR